LPDGASPGGGLQGRWCCRPRGSVMHSYSLDGAGRYNKPRTKKQRHEPMSMNESRKFGMVGAFGMRRSL
jgi:hypothetical protein